MRTEALLEATAPAVPSGQAAPAARAPARPRRRRYWVDRASQLPTTMLAVLATAAFIILFNLTLGDLTTARREQIAASAPALERRLRSEDRAFLRSIAILSGVFAVCVSVGMVFLTKRSAGPSRRIQAHLEKLARGDLESTVQLRERVEKMYGAEVAAILPLNFEIVRLASSSIFVNRCPDHPMTHALNQVAARVMA